jgi:ribosome-associated protein
MPDRGSPRFRTLAILAARTADEKKAEDVVVRSIAPISPLAEFLVVASVTSRAQMEAVQEHIRLKLKDLGAEPVHRDGGASELWRIMDYGGLLVHLMHPKARDFYSIDKLFHEARRIRWQPDHGSYPEGR